jgi:hypothetical protein
MAKTRRRRQEGEDKKEKTRRRRQEGEDKKEKTRRRRQEGEDKKEKIRRRRQGEDKKGEAKRVMTSVSVIGADYVYKAGLPPLFPSSSCSL